MHIIIKGASSKCKSAPRFVPHMNRTLGKYYHSARDYYQDMKKGGYVPYDSSIPDHGKRKDYKLSKKAEEVVASIHESTKKGKFRPSDRLIDGMRSVGVKTHISKSDLAKLPKHYQEGGTYAS